MAFKTGFRTTLRWMFWPVIVVAALNIENRATEFGYANISPEKVLGSEFVTDIYLALVSETSENIVLFLIGAIVFAWIGHFLDKLDESTEWWPLFTLSNYCESLQPFYAKDGISRRLFSIEKELPKANQLFAKFNFPELPQIDPQNEVANARVALYLRTIKPFMNTKNVDYAREIGKRSGLLNGLGESPNAGAAKVD